MPRQTVRTIIAVGALLLLAAAMPGAKPAWAKDDLVIGVAQFPSSLHPDIDAEVIKAYVVGFALRPITTQDAAWKTTCLLCTELPDGENGLTKLEDLPGGGQGMAVTIKLKPDLKWSDGHPLTTKDLGLHLEGRPRPQLRLQQHQSMEPRPQHRCGRRPHRGAASRQGLGVLRPLGRDPARAHRGPGLRQGIAGPGDYIKQTSYNRAPLTQGLYNGPVHDHRLPVGRADRAGAEPLLGRAEARLQAHRDQADRQHRRAAGEPAVGRCGHGERRGRRPHHRPGASRCRSSIPTGSATSSSRA